MNGNLKILCRCGFLIVLMLGCALCVAAQTKAKKTAKAAASKTAQPNNEQLPRRVDAETAVSPVYALNSKNCRAADYLINEGSDFGRRCAGFGDYVLQITGFGDNLNYGIAAKNRNKYFTVMLFPLESGEASDFVRADQYREKLADQIEWRLDKNGKPFAVVVRAGFYKNTRSKKNAPDKAAEFYLVRGLAGFEDLQVDVPATDTAFNPLEQARKIAAEYLEKLSGEPRTKTKQKR